MMWPRRLRRSVRSIWAGMLCLGLLGGCYTWTTGCMGPEEGKPPLLVPEPNGTFVHKMQEVQVTKAEASDFVFFLDEWYMGGTILGPHGMYHLGHIMPRLPHVPFPVVIQPSHDQPLNETRRRQIVAALLRGGIADAEQRVIIAFPDAEGLYGEEAPRIYSGLLRSNYGGGYGLQGGYGLSGGYGGYGLGGYGAFNRPGLLNGFVPGVNPFGF